jgi:hypothetical protein
MSPIASQAQTARSRRPPQQCFLLARGGLRGGIIGRRRFVCHHFQGLRSTPSPEFAANGVGRDVAHDSTQPLAEFARVAQFFEPMPRGDAKGKKVTPNLG